MTRRCTRAAHAARFILALGLSAPGAQLPAQLPLGASTRELVAVNTDVERYLRVLQDAGVSPAYPWSVREFGPREIDSLIPADTTHPWGARVRRAGLRWAEWYLLAPEAQAIYNSTYPYGYNDGALWAGRGLTSAAQAGVGGHVGRLSFTFEPEAFWAENRSFSLMPNGQTGRLQFADGINPRAIDQPQRFGNAAYQQFDFGQSTVRLDLPIVAVGLSTANQHWGPAIDNPIILGNNAAGFPHLFIGTTEPVDLYLLKLQARVEWGRLSQSAYGVLQGDSSRRFMSGLVGTIVPRGLPNLEIGGARFFHTLWTGALSAHDFSRPFEGLLLSSLSDIGNGTGQEADNQLASLFARWVFPRSGIEFYAEYGREDHNADRRDLTQEPDHDAAYLLGLQKVWRRAAMEYWAFHAEILNSRISHLALGRPQTPFYVHTPVAQGHTENGQVLGAASGYGGGGFSLSGERYDPAGHWALTLSKLGRWQDLGADGLPNALGADAMYSVRVERGMFTRHADVMANVTLTTELNRNFGGDVGNVTLGGAVRPHW